MATDNSASFIRFPLHHRHGTLFIPVRRSTADTHSSPSLSSILRDSPSRSFVSVEQRTNPILNNSLLNYRKEQVKPSVDTSPSTRLCLSSKPTRSGSTEAVKSTIRASTAPAHHTTADRNLSDMSTETSDKRQHSPYVDETKYDYITRWVNEVRTATYASGHLAPRSRRH